MGWNADHGKEEKAEPLVEVPRSPRPAEATQQERKLSEILKGWHSKTVLVDQAQSIDLPQDFARARVESLAGSLLPDELAEVVHAIAGFFVSVTEALAARPHFQDIWSVSGP